MVVIAITPILQMRKLRPKVRQLVGSLTLASAINFYTLLLQYLRLREKRLCENPEVGVIREGFMSCSSGRAPLKELCP